MAFALIAVLLGLALAVGFTDSAADDDPPGTIDGTDGDDEILGGGADEHIRGLGGDDILRDGGGDDTLEGGDGNDRLFSSLGDDRMDGGAGNDLLQSWTGRDTLLGGDGDDLLLAQSADGTLADGGAGNDDIHWIDGEGTMRGGAGDDAIRLGGGDGPRSLADGLVEGGDGTDLLDLYAVLGDVDLVFTDDGAGTLTDGSGNVAFTGIEELRLSYQTTRVDASATTTGLTITGDLEDTRFGDGYSTITGGSGDDHFINGTVMDGGAGDDLLVRTSGGGTLTGGEGADVFDIQHNRGYDADYLPSASATTRITDFTPGEDRISLVVEYDEHFVDPNGQVYDNDPPEISIVEDPDTGETHVMVNNDIALRLEGVSGLTLDDIEVEIRAY